MMSVKEFPQRRQEGGSSLRRAPKPQRLNCVQVAALAGLSVSTVYRAIRRGSLHSIKIEGLRFILYNDLVAWLQYDPLDTD